MLGVGIDLIDLERAARLLDRHGDRMLQRLFTPGERDYLRAQQNPVPHLAARLAAKEAVYKALQGLPGSRGISWRDIEVERNEAGRPSVRLHGVAGRLALESGGLKLHLSLTHSATTAGAVAIAELT